jgi:hypothetical protein
VGTTGPWLQAPTNFDVEVTRNGTDWVTVLSGVEPAWGTGGPDDWSLVAYPVGFDTVDGVRGLRLKVNNANLYGSASRWKIAELGVVGKEALAPGSDRIVADRGETLVVPVEDGVLSNDSGQYLAVTGHTQPGQGSLVINADGSYTFTAPPDFTGSTTATYTVAGKVWDAATGVLTDVSETAELVISLRADKAALQSAVDDAGDLVEADYTPESWAPFELALSAAQDVLDDDAASQGEVDDALSALESAVAGLEPRPAPGLDLSVAPGARCIAGKAYLTVTAANNSDVAAAVTVTTPYGVKVFPAVAPGQTAFHSFTTRAVSYQDALITVAGTAIGDQSVTGSAAAPATGACGG